MCVGDCLTCFSGLTDLASDSPAWKEGPESKWNPLRTNAWAAPPAMLWLSHTSTLPGRGNGTEELVERGSGEKDGDKRHEQMNEAALSDWLPFSWGKAFFKERKKGNGQQQGAREHYRHALHLPGDGPDAMTQGEARG